MYSDRSTCRIYLNDMKIYYLCAGYPEVLEAVVILTYTHKAIKHTGFEGQQVLDIMLRG